MKAAMRLEASDGCARPEIPKARHRAGFSICVGVPERFKGDALRSSLAAGCKQQGRVARAADTRSYVGSNPTADSKNAGDSSQLP